MFVANPNTHGACKLACAVPIVVKHNKTLHLDAFAQQGAHQQAESVRARRQRGGVVVGHQAAHWNAGLRIEPGQHRVEHRPANALKVHVDALGAGRGKVTWQVVFMVINTKVKTQLVDHITALVLAPSNTDDMAAFEFGDLSNDRAHRATGRGDHHSFSRHGLADVKQAHVGRHAWHAQHAERPRGVGVVVGQGR